MSKGLNLKTIDYLRQCVEAREKLEGPRIGDFIFLKNGNTERFSHDWGDSLQTSSSGSFCLSSDGRVSFSGGLNPSINKGKIRETSVNHYNDHTGFSGMTGKFWVYYNGRLCANCAVHVNLDCRVYKEL